MVFGTFDILHPGHLAFFKQAKKLAKSPYLIVSVARDKNVIKIKNRKPLYSEQARLKNIKKIKIAQKVVLGAQDDYLGHIKKYHPHIIALGYDQRAYVKGLKQALKGQGLIVTIKRLKAFKPQIYKSSKLAYARTNPSRTRNTPSSRSGRSGLL